MMATKPTIGIDFDGVIYARPRTETGNMQYDAEPVPGSIHFLRNCAHAFNISIYSARFSGPMQAASIAACKAWLRKTLHEENLILRRRGKPEFDAVALLNSIEFSATKPVARVYLDDRAVCFTGTFPSISLLLSFRTWEGR